MESFEGVVEKSNFAFSWLKRRKFIFKFILILKNASCCKMNYVFMKQKRRKMLVLFVIYNQMNDMKLLISDFMVSVTGAY